MALIEKPPLDAGAAVLQDDEALWRHYRLAPDGALRDALVRRYEKLVRMLAAKAFAQRFSAELEFSDYFQFGMVGLLEALDRFDPGHGVRFEAFGARRITGAILDGVESLSEKQRQIATRQALRRERAASLRENATAAQRPADLLDRLAGVAIGLALGLLLEDTGMYSNGVEPAVDNAYQQIELRQLQQRVRDAVQQLPAQERLVITLHYLQLRPFEQIATEQNLSKGRISQIHHRALARLRVGGLGLQRNDTS
ncbi:sigma-70 family RNA polymerase sigma factor [Rhizobacter sp. P5_C2]